MPDGSPMVTTQAATVLAVYRHIAKTVAALEPERVKEVIDSLALAAGNLEPGTALELLLQEEHAGRRHSDRRRAASSRSTISRSRCCWRARCHRRARPPTAWRKCSTRWRRTSSASGAS